MPNSFINPQQKCETLSGRQIDARSHDRVSSDILPDQIYCETAKLREFDKTLMSHLNHIYIRSFLRSATKVHRHYVYEYLALQTSLSFPHRK